jgi:hypothetical protein
MMISLTDARMAKAMHGFADGMKNMGELLGNDHGLAVPEAALKTCKLDAEELKAVRGQAQRAALQQTVFKLGRRLFAAEPSVFLCLMRTSMLGSFLPIQVRLRPFAMVPINLNSGDSN